MEHKDHVNLIRDAVADAPGLWADFGAGEGAFTLALADILTPNIEIYSVDVDAKSLHIQEQSFHEMFPDVMVHYVVEDFTKPLKLPRFEGIIMANALHYVKDKTPFLKTLRNHLKPHGRLVLVEYNVDRGNHWVPYPVSYKTFEKTAEDAGYTDCRLVSTIPSSFLEEMYSAVCFI